MAGMSANSRAMAGRWGGTGDGTKPEVRRQARRIEARVVSRDVEADLFDETDSAGHWAPQNLCDTEGHDFGSTGICSDCDSRR